MAMGRHTILTFCGSNEMIKIMKHHKNKAKCLESDEIAWFEMTMNVEVCVYICERSHVCVYVCLR